jgi:hypothetical protein
VTGLFARALGEAWDDLHPQIRDRYGLVAGEHREAVGRGTMQRLTRHPLAVPVLWLGTHDDFLFPEQGTDVPFSITTEAFVDEAGNEALFLRREFETDPPRQFVDTLRWNPERECITDLMGRGGHVVTDLSLDVEEGDLVLDIGRQWLRVRGRYVPLPGPLAASGTLRDCYADRFRVSAEIGNALLGRIFAYEGTFQNEFHAVDADAPTESRLGGVALPGGSR